MIRIPELGKPEESGRLPGSVVSTVNDHGTVLLRGFFVFRLPWDSCTPKTILQKFEITKRRRTWNRSG
jgi:hypothetical protein